MKNKMKLLSIIAGCFAMIIGFSSCIKNKLPLETDLSNLQDHVDIVKGGLTYYSAAGVIFGGSDTVNMTLIVNLSSANLPSSPIKVTIGVDASKIDTYNAANNTKFQEVPDGSYSIASTTLTIPAGQQYAETTVSFYSDALDPSVSYMLPISIMDASGKALTANLNTAYYHIIGNPIAGTYEQYFSRWLSADSTGGSGTANYYNLDVGPVIFSPASPTEVQVESAAFGETNIIDFVDNGGVLSDFTVSFADQATLAAMEGTDTYGPPTLEAADPVAGYYKVVYKYTIGANVRLCVNTFVKQ